MKIGLDESIISNPIFVLKEGILSDSLWESSQKIGTSASERKPLWELGRAERTDRVGFRMETS